MNWNLTKLKIKWAALLLPSLFMAVFARIIAPILPFFANDEGYLPNWLWWFQTPFDTLDGDRGSWERHPGTGKWDTYKRRVFWLWRNAGYGFDMRVCGIKVNPDTDKIIYEGDPDIGDNTGISGRCDWFAYKDGDMDNLIAFQWYYVKHYSLFNGKFKKCIRVGWGWKIWSEEKLHDEPAQYWAYANPIK